MSSDNRSQKKNLTKTENESKIRIFFFILSLRGWWKELMEFSKLKQKKISASTKMNWVDTLPPPRLDQ